LEVLLSVSFTTGNGIAPAPCALETIDVEFAGAVVDLSISLSFLVSNACDLTVVPAEAKFVGKTGTGGAPELCLDFNDFSLLGALGALFVRCRTWTDAGERLVVRGGKGLSVTDLVHKGQQNE